MESEWYAMVYISWVVSVSKGCSFCLGAVWVLELVLSQQDNAADWSGAFEAQRIAWLICWGLWS